MAFCQNGVQKLCVSTFGFGISVESPIHEPSFTGFYVKSSYHYKKVNNVKFREIKSGTVLSIAAGGILTTFIIICENDMYLLYTHSFSVEFLKKLST